MKWSLINETDGQPPRLTLSGNLGIRHSNTLQQLLMQHAAEGRGLCLEVREVEELDLSFLQLLLAFSHQLQASRQPFILHMHPNPVAAHQLRVSGFSFLHQ